MDIFWFNMNIKPVLEEYSVKYSSFSDGDFGDLERVELEGFGKMGTVEFWSKGWLGIDVYDCSCEMQIMNTLLAPDEGGKMLSAFDSFVKILNSKDK